jgi:hypothetical protein
MTPDSRQLTDFTSIVMEGHGDLLLVHGETPSIIIETDPETIEHLRVEVVDGKLRLGMKSWLDYILHSWKQVNYTVTFCNLEAVTVSGSGKVRAQVIEAGAFQFHVSGSSSLMVEKLTTSDLQIHISGSGDIDLSGSAKKQKIRISGSGKMEAWALDSESADVVISGSGEIMLKVSEKLDVSISGSGSVRYLGNPQVNHSISGSGSVKQVS